MIKCRKVLVKGKTFTNDRPPLEIFVVGEKEDVEGVLDSWTKGDDKLPCFVVLSKENKLSAPMILDGNFGAHSTVEIREEIIATVAEGGDISEISIG